MKKKKIFTFAIILAVVLLIAAGVVRYLWTVPAESAVDKTYSGWLMFPDGRGPVSCQVRLAGTYYHYRLGNDMDRLDGGYESGLFVDGVRPFEYFLIYFREGEDYEAVSILHSNVDSGLQNMAVSNALDMVVAEVSYDTQREKVVPWGSGDKCLLVAPADNLEEVEYQISRMSADFQENDWDTEWFEYPFIHTGAGGTRLLLLDDPSVPAGRHALK